MKTHTIKIDNAELLILELPETGSTFDVLMAINSEAEGYTLLGKPDEISEEEAEKLFYNPIDSTNLTHYANLRNLFSLIESEIYWENPYCEKVFVNMDISASMVRAANREIYSEKWMEAEQKTFDRSRTIIFKKVIR